MLVKEATGDNDLTPGLVTQYCSIECYNHWSGNALSLVQHQPIMWTNGELLSMRHFERNFSKIWIKYIFFPHENTFKNIICKISAILSCFSWVNPCVVLAGSWSLQFERGSGLVTLRSLSWIGYTFYHVPGSRKFGSVYVGTGEKNMDLPFMLWNFLNVRLLWTWTAGIMI